VTADEITLTLPGERDFYRIAHLVLGGLAIRLDLTYEQLEDLQLALSSVLAEQEPEGELNVTLRVEDGAIRAVIGPFTGGRLREAIEEADGEHLDLRRLLETVCDRVSVEERDGAGWIELTKSVEGMESP
jgi:anti-sigma regulatory factor (Ser/Thr protein kinase)